MMKSMLCLFKYKVLKPCYNFVGKFSPSIATEIRNCLYGALDYLCFREIGTLDSVDVFVDDSITARMEFTTGIQRVVRKIIDNVSANVVVGEVYRGNQLITSNRVKSEIQSIKHDKAGKLVKVSGIRKLVLLDSSWNYRNFFEKCIDCVYLNGGRSYAIVYDLIPIRYSKFVDSEVFAKIFTDWHDMILQKADQVMCISKAVADDVIAYYEEKGFKREKPLVISYFPLGADIQEIKEVNLKFVRKRLQRFFDKPTFLMVGTLEPRKGHMVALQAFTKLLDAGQNINLLIIGRNGWKNDDIRHYIAQSKYNKTNILWLEDASDYELTWAYQKSCCLIAASLDEGYGLPLVEGAQYGIPLICSDIPVFREVSQGYADFFKVFDADALAECVEKWLQTDIHPDSSKMKIYTWKEVADIFMEIIEGKREPYKVLE